jgi:hypothetical protein
MSEFNAMLPKAGPAVLPKPPIAETTVTAHQVCVGDEVKCNDGAWRPVSGRQALIGARTVLWFVGVDDGTTLPNDTPLVVRPHGP